MSPQLSLKDKIIRKLKFYSDLQHLKRRLYFINWIKLSFTLYILKNKILKRAYRLALPTLPTTSSSSNTDLVIALKVSTEIRYSIFHETMNETFSKLKTTYPIHIYDASSTKMSQKIKNEFNSYPTILPEYNSKPELSFPERLQEYFYKHNRSNFLMLFDDQLIYNMTDKHIQAGEALLSKFSGLVDIIYFGQIQVKAIEHANSCILLSKKQSIIEKFKKNKLIDITIYGIKFGIYKNESYGFVFNTIMGNSKRYSKSLNWYIRNISQESPQEIELSTYYSIKRGPVYEYIAIFENSFMIDLDYEGTEYSVRDSSSRAGNREIFHYLKKGYSFKCMEE